MAEKRGCLKNGLLGCGGLLAVGVLFIVIMAGMAAVGLRKGDRIDSAPTPEFGETTLRGLDPVQLTTLYPGRVVLDLGQGEFRIHTAAPGEGLGAHARFDSEVHAVGQSFTVAADSSWVCQISFRQTMPGLQALFRNMMGKDTNAEIDVYLPPDVPIELVVRFEQGGGEVELGGLWLTTADFDVKQGGFALSIDEPLQQPMERLRLYSRMGGVQAMSLGNASPRVLDINCTMGGADISLRGDWLNDCDAHFGVKMGGVAVRVPEHLEVSGDAELAGELRHTDREMPIPQMRATVVQSMGEVEIYR